MSRFITIDEKLEKLSASLGAKLTKDRPGYVESLRTFEERRIDWEEDGIRKAIIIQPTFEAVGVNSSLWNFINIAWVVKHGIPQKPGWKKKLIVQKDFNEIEEAIDNLLKESVKNLQKVSLKDILF